MKNAIWKWPIKASSVNELTMPVGAQILAVQLQHGEPQLWARVDPDAVQTVRRFQVMATGTPWYSEAVPRYLGTFQIDGGVLVFHLFEVD